MHYWVSIAQFHADAFVIQVMDFTFKCTNLLPHFFLRKAVDKIIGCTNYTLGLTVTTRFFHLFIIKNPVDSGEVCPGPSGNITQYQISFHTESFETVNIARCTAQRCKHTFEPAPNPPSSYDNVSVAAKNVVGVGAARTCTTQLISELHLSPSCCKNICTSTVCLFYVTIIYCCYFVSLNTNHKRIE